MPRFLPALIVLAGLFLLPNVAEARRLPADPPLSAAERKRQWGEILVLGMLAGAIGVTVVVKGTREFIACLPKGRQYHPDDDYDD